MSFDSKEEAAQRAEQILKKLKGKNWKAHVHENMGWHFSLYNGPMTLHEDRYRQRHTFSTLLNGKCHDDDNYHSGGEIYWSPGGSSDDPNKAVQKQYATAMQHFKSILEVLRHIEAFCGVDKIEFSCGRIGLEPADRIIDISGKDSVDIFVRRFYEILEENKQLNLRRNEAINKIEDYREKAKSSEKEIVELKEKLKNANSLVWDLFHQACYVKIDPSNTASDAPRKYDHCCMSMYEEAQDYLIDNGFIGRDECLRK